MSSINTLNTYYKDYNIKSHCPKCLKEYQLSAKTSANDDHAEAFSSNFPLVLKCGHNLCESCLVGNRQIHFCDICGISYDFRDLSSLQIHNLFEVDFFLVGKLYYEQTLHSSATKRRHFMGKTKPLADIRSDVCAECELRQAIGYCQSCHYTYCKECFDKVHQSSKILSSHTLQIFKTAESEQRLSRELGGKRICKVHRFEIHFFCRKCRLECCIICIQMEHKKHDFAKISEENLRFKKDVELWVDYAQCTKDVVASAQQDLLNVEKRFDDYVVEAQHEISINFQHLHSILQNHEKTVQDELRENCKKPSNILKSLSKMFEIFDEDLKSIVLNLESFQTDTPTNFSIANILHDYQTEIRSINSQIISIKQFQTTPFIIEFHDNYAYNLNKVIQLHYTEPANLREISISCFGHNNKHKRAQVSSGNNNDNNNSFHDYFLNKRLKNEASQQCEAEAAAAAAAANESSHDVTFSTGNSFTRFKLNQQSLLSETMMELQLNDASSLVNIENPPREAEEEPFLDVNDKVQVSAVVTPKDFYIQSVRLLEKVNELAENYNALTDTRYLQALKLNKDEIYMIKALERRSKWCRAKLLSTSREGNWEWFLIDYGTTMKSSAAAREDILKVSFGLSNIRAAAVHCSIYGIDLPIFPKPKEANNFIFHQLTSKKFFKVIAASSNASGTKLEIDLVPFESPESGSVRDALLFTGAAFSTNIPVKDPPEAPPHNRYRKEKLAANVWESVKVINISDPHKFSVVKVSELASRRQFMDKMNLDFQQNSKQFSSNLIYNAALYLACLCHIKGQVFRCSVRTILPGGSLVVHLVDEGVMRTVQWYNIFAVPEHYKEPKEFAFICSLADVKPASDCGLIWNEEAVLEFKNMTMNKNLLMRLAPNGSCENNVELVVKKGLKHFSIGAVLVKKHLAVSTGPLSHTIEVDYGVADLAQKSSSAKTRQQEDESLFGKIKRTDIQIVHIVDPGEFYVVRCIDVPGIRIFHDEIQSYAERNQGKMPKVKWSHDDECFVLLNLFKHVPDQVYHSCEGQNRKGCGNWFRGQIKGIILNSAGRTNYTVFLKDIGMVVSNVTGSHMQSMPTAYKNVANAAYRCHLACLKPKNNLAAWPAEVADFFKGLVQRFEGLQVTMQSQKDAVTNSIPVIVWGIQTKVIDALAPSVVNYENFIRLFVAQDKAKLTEPLNFTKEMNKLLTLNLNQEQEASKTISWDKWLQEFWKDARGKQAAREESLFDVLGRLEDFEEIKRHLQDLNTELSTGQTATPKAWLSSQPIHQRNFGAFPSFVDSQGHIHLQQCEMLKLVEFISQQIHQTYMPLVKSLKQQLPPQIFAVGQPCIVQNCWNNQYCRGIVQTCKADGHYDVHFIDFGYIEDCAPDDLLPFAPFRTLPALCSKFHLSDIKPKDNKAYFSNSALDALHKLILDKCVFVEVKDADKAGGESRPCRMRLNGRDVASQLVVGGYVDWQSDDSDETAPSFCYQAPMRKSMGFVSQQARSSI